MGLVVDLEAMQRAANASPVKGLAQDFLESQQVLSFYLSKDLSWKDTALNDTYDFDPPPLLVVVIIIALIDFILP